jgi:hypothetical protein
MKINKTLLNKIKQFKLTTPVAIIIASIIFSFHYVWINKYEFIPNGLTKTSFTIVNKWTGESCMTFVDMDDIDALEYRLPALCDTDDANFVYGDKAPFNHEIELP